MVRLSAVRFSLEKIAKLLRDSSASHTVVVVGAGISVPSGIRDFTTPKSGLFDNLEQYDLPYPSAVFEIEYFKKNPKPFFQVAKGMYPGLFHPNTAHWFIRLLAEKDLLQRCYTQNIDGLETVAGLPRTRLVEAHGSLATATCQGCKKKYTSEEIKETVFQGDVPTCSKCQGVIKPNITFIGETLPDSFMLSVKDMSRANLVIVMGTSLEVPAFDDLVDKAQQGIPRLLINFDKVGSFEHETRPNDTFLQGDVIDGVTKLVKLCGWNFELKELEGLYKAQNPH